VTAQAPPLRQSIDTFGGGGAGLSFFREEKKRRFLTGIFSLGGGGARNIHRFFLDKLFEIIYLETRK